MAAFLGLRRRASGASSRVREDPALQGITGQCQAIVPSNLSDPTANCLNSFSALEAALTTHSSTVSAANANNPIWQTLGEPTLQVVVPGISSPSQLMNANSNMVVYFGDPAVYPYPTLK